MEQLASDTCRTEELRVFSTGLVGGGDLLEVCQLESQEIYRNEADNYQTD